jgi:hypothetical protein
MACGCDDRTAVAACEDIPELERLTYFYGQALGVKELQAEQQYFRTLLRLQARWLGGYGVVCGLEISLEPAGRPDCTEPEDTSEAVDVVLSPGIAVDCLGQLLVVRRRQARRLSHLLASRELRDRYATGAPLWLSICHAKVGTYPTRPVVVDPCEPLECSQYGRLRDCVHIELRGQAPPPAGCDQCCTGCDEPCLALAVLMPGEKGEAAPWNVDNGIRRLFGRHALTTIVGTSWSHGASYAREDADALLDDGLRVRFSGPVLIDSLRRGVVDVLVWQGGAGLRDQAYRKPGVIRPLEPKEGRHGQVTTEFRFELSTDERLQSGDQVLFVLRSDFVLDDCCRAIDGNHIGGRVPELYPSTTPGRRDPWASCEWRPDRPGAWTSGNGVEGGTFESWFFVELPSRRYRNRAPAGPEREEGEA